MDEKKLGHFIKSRMEELKKEILSRQLERQPHLKKKYHREQLDRCLQDIEYHLSYLSQALSVNQVLLFEEYMHWVKILFEERNLSVDELQVNLEIIEEILSQHLPEERAHLSPFIAGGQKGLTRPSSQLTFLHEKNPYLQLAQSYLQSLLTQDRSHSLSLILPRVQEGMPPQDVYRYVFQPVMREVGYLWQRNRLSVAREHYCTATTQLIMSHLYPYLLNPSIEKDYRCISLCVSGELHELGIRMVADLLEMASWDTLHLGANTPQQGILELIQEKRVHLLAISATLTLNLGQVRDLIEAVQQSSPWVKVMVGGYPFNLSGNLWQKLGAHGFAPDAQRAVQVARELVSKSS